MTNFEYAKKAVDIAEAKTILALSLFPNDEYYTMQAKIKAEEARAKIAIMEIMETKAED